MWKLGQNSVGHKLRGGELRDGDGNSQGNRSPFFLDVGVLEG